MILLHPWFGCWQFWRQTVEALPESETFSVDLYSLGAGDDWQRFARPQGLAEALGALLDGLRIQRCSVVGNSMGGIAAQALAATRGEQIRRLVLVGTGARTVGVKPGFRRALDEWIAGETDPACTERLLDALLARRPAPEEFDRFVEMSCCSRRVASSTIPTPTTTTCPTMSTSRERATSTSPTR